MANTAQANAETTTTTAAAAAAAAAATRKIAICMTTLESGLAGKQTTQVGKSAVSCPHSHLVDDQKNTFYFSSK